MEGQAKVNKPVHSALHFNKCNKLMDAAVSHISDRSIFSVMNTKSQQKHMEIYGELRVMEPSTGPGRRGESHPPC